MISAVTSKGAATTLPATGTVLATALVPRGRCGGNAAAGQGRGDEHDQQGVDQEPHFLQTPAEAAGCYQDATSLKRLKVSICWSSLGMRYMG